MDLATSLARPQSEPAPMVSIVCGAVDPGGHEVNPNRLLVQFHIVGHLPECGLVVAGFVSDPRGQLDRVTLAVEGSPPVQLGTDAPILSRADAHTVFRAPHGLAVTFGFVALLAGAPPAASAHVLLRLRSGGVLRQDLPATGNLADLPALVARAPQDYALSVLAHLSQGVGLAPLPLLIERMAQQAFDQIDPSFDYGSGDGAVAAAFHIDMAMRIGIDGILLKGWLLGNPLDRITDLSVVSFRGHRTAMSLPLPALGRPDVLESRIADGLAAERNCGFVAFASLPGLSPSDTRWFVNITTQRGAVRRVGFICGAAQPPMPAIQSIVALAESSAVDFNDLFARALAPALDCVWGQMQAARPAPVVHDYGTPPEGAAVSIVVPLYGRMDFVRHQIASFSNDPDFRAAARMVELIYVLDDPSAEDSLLDLCRLLHDIYGVPFRVVLQKGNFGYSAANNAGARLATGRMLLLLNSDVMPRHTRWVSALVNTQAGLPDCGVLGCRLLFEDGSIQHAGMNFRPSLFFKEAWTNEHGFKGLPTAFDPHKDTEAVAGVTGACLLIDRTLFMLVGGISEDYVIGDFEDSDLCLKIHRRGLKVYYTPHVELYHLERQSMKRIGHGHEGWRQSLTFFNMWKHSQRWRALIPVISQTYDHGATIRRPAGPAAQPAPAAPVSITQAAPAAHEPATPDATAPEPATLLQRFEALQAGHEDRLLPAISVPARTHFTIFPARSAVLTPFEPADFDIELPRVSIFEFDHVTLHGFRLFERDGHVFNDQSLVDPTSQSDRHFQEKSARGENEEVVMGADGRPAAAQSPEEIDATDCLILSSDEPTNFGSWIYRFLTKFALARSTRPISRVFAYDDDRWMRPVLQMVDPDVEIVPQKLGRAYRIANPRIISLPAPHVYFRPEITACFSEIAARIGQLPDLPERLYVSRRKQSQMQNGLRIMENEDELVARLARFGFTEFIPEDHPLPVQVAAFAQARLIVSPGGSNLFCAAFAQQADFILDIESGDDWSYAHMNLLASTQRPFSLVRGQRSNDATSVHANWTVDVDAVIEGLQSLAILGRGS